MDIMFHKENDMAIDFFARLSESLPGRGPRRKDPSWYNEIRLIVDEYEYNQLDVKNAIMLALKYGQTDGAHHKMWLIDQILRHLLHEDLYSELVGIYRGHGFDWDTGIAP